MFSAGLNFNFFKTLALALKFFTGKKMIRGCSEIKLCFDVPYKC